MEHAWSVDADKDACATYRANICPDAPESVICADVRSVDMAALPEVDALLFGFPCNDFSEIGERRGLDGNFGPLYRIGIDYLVMRQPQWFLAENVSGLAVADGGRVLRRILSEMAAAGYRVTAHLYRLEEYCVPQMRHRIFIVGIRDDLNMDFRVPAPTGKLMTAGRALADIAHDAANHEIVEMSPLAAERLACIGPGQNIWSVNDTLPDRLRLNVRGAKISSLYRRLDPDRPAHTVLAGGGGGTHLYHWSEKRALSNREKARLQTFPDDFVFHGGRQSVRKQVGMAVPPAGAAHILRAVMNTFDGILYESVEPNLGVYDTAYRPEVISMAHVLRNPRRTDHAAFV